MDHKTFSQALRAYERKNRGWVDHGTGVPTVVFVDGVQVSYALRAHRKRGVVEVAVTDSEGRPVMGKDDVLTKFIHGKVKLVPLEAVKDKE